jgi:hypothetical protein|tara:strand:- start:1155 stop:1334 length:180 start_codon:yes stop_codon:yes gene_type:complete
MTAILGDIIIASRLTTITNSVIINGKYYEVEDIGDEISFEEFSWNVQSQFTFPKQGESK